MKIRKLNSDNSKTTILIRTMIGDVLLSEGIRTTNFEKEKLTKEIGKV